MSGRRLPLPIKTPRPHQAVICECGGEAVVVTGATVYPHRHDLAGKFLWQCPKCKAYVGCHSGTLAPLGMPCGPETRRARMRAHEIFDPMWRAKMRHDNLSQGEAREWAYRWLAGQLGIEASKCHIAMMDRATALRVVEVCLQARQQRAAS